MVSEFEIHKGDLTFAQPLHVAFERRCPASHVDPSCIVPTTRIVLVKSPDHLYGGTCCRQSIFTLHRKRPPWSRNGSSRVPNVLKEDVVRPIDLGDRQCQTLLRLPLERPEVRFCSSLIVA